MFFTSKMSFKVCIYYAKTRKPSFLSCNSISWESVSRSSLLVQHARMDLKDALLPKEKRKKSTLKCSILYVNRLTDCVCMAMPKETRFKVLFFAYSFESEWRTIGNRCEGDILKK